MITGGLSWIVGAIALLAILAVLAIRVVWRGQSLVVLSPFGGVVAVRAPGVTFVMPGIHRTIRVLRSPVRVDLFWIDAVTADGVTVTVNASMLVTVRDPATFALASISDEIDTASVAETHLRRYVATQDLPQLRRVPVEYRQRLAARVNTRVRVWGMEVSELEFYRVEIRLKDDLVRWAESQAAPHQDKQEHDDSLASAT